MPPVSVDHKSNGFEGENLETEPEKGKRSLEGMECLIPVINKLRDVFDRTGGSSTSLQLPQIVVLGGQSSGKSSVLESLVGKPFLPRGSGIVTRCPIVLNLVNVQEDEEWAEFDHKKDVRFKLKEVENEIRAQQDVIAGTKKGITNQKIQLTVYSPNVLTLTVVDLPGLVKVAVEDQPEDIEKQITDLVTEYISQPNSVILAVSPGNADIATSDSIKMAKSVDPFQERTLAVITKLDLAEEGALNDVLSGRTLPMKLGIVGVINRSQKDLESGITHDEVLNKERAFLKQKYPSLAQSHGTQFLASKLNNVLMQHIRKCCPALDMKVKQLLSERRAALEALGDGGNLSDREKNFEMLNIIDKFAKAYKGQIDGQSRTEMVTGELTGGARIDYIMGETLAKSLIQLNPLESITDVEIVVAIRNATGIGMRLSQPEIALHHLITREVAKMKAVILHCARLVHQEMISVINKCMDRAHRFPKANSGISQVTNDLLNRRMEVTREILENYIDVQASSGLTWDVEYHSELETLMADINMVDLGDIPTGLVLNGGGIDPLLGLPNDVSLRKEPSVRFTDQQMNVISIMKVLLEKYFKIVRRQVQDHVPKSLQHSLIFHVVDRIHVELNSKLCSPDKVDELIQEPESLAFARKNLVNEVEGLTEASRILDEVRDINCMAP